MEKHWPDVPRFRDIHTLTKEAFYERTGKKELTLASGSFPCQPFSSIGPKRGLRTPVTFLAGNVPRSLTNSGPIMCLAKMLLTSSIWGSTKRSLTWQKAGYAVWTFVLPACAVGAWHERKRTFIVGIDVSYSLAADTGSRTRTERISISSNEAFRRKKRDGRYWSAGLLKQSIF
ncbi:MAG: DNA cytosine methyltransferase [Coprococcus phoceensis]